MDEFYLVQERRATDFEAPKLGKSSSGSTTDGFEGNEKILSGTNVLEKYFGMRMNLLRKKKLWHLRTWQ